MNYAGLSGLSQENMEEWFRNRLAPTTPMLQSGLVGKMQPSFVRCNFEEGTAVMSYAVMPWEMNPQNVMHGGILSSAFDTTLGILCHYYHLPHNLTTINISTTFIKPVFADNTLYMEAKIDHLGNSLVTTSGKVWIDDENNPVAICNATFKVFRTHAKRAARKEDLI